MDFWGVDLHYVGVVYISALDPLGSGESFQPGPIGITLGGPRFVVRSLFLGSQTLDFPIYPRLVIAGCRHL